MLFLSFGVTWTGARVFDGRPVLPMYLVAGSVALAHRRAPAGLSCDLDLRFLLASGIVTTYTWLTAYEFWRGRSEPLVSRWPAIFMLFAHGALFLLRTPLFAMLPWSTASEVMGSVWLTVLSFEALLFTIAIAFILLAMAKERTEYRHRTAAMVDPLTGIANRRSFLQDGNELAKRHAASKRSTAVLLIDLDHFKSINDRFGHAIGDRVLQVFAETAKANLRSTDLIGRLGGEEFAAVLYDVGREKAVAQAERIRSTFAEVAGEVDGRPVAATVSIGIVVNGTSRSTCRTARAGRPGALLCQGARPQPRRGRDARPRSAAAGRGGRRGDGQDRRLSGLTGDRTRTRCESRLVLREPEARVRLPELLLARRSAQRDIVNGRPSPWETCCRCSSN